MLDDERVLQYWDRDLLAGTWFGEHLDDIGAGDQTSGVYWDAFLVFDKDARWDAVPSPLVHAGATVISQSENLHAALTPLM